MRQYEQQQKINGKGQHKKNFPFHESSMQSRYGRSIALFCRLLFGFLFFCIPGNILIHWGGGDDSAAFSVRFENDLNAQVRCSGTDCQYLPISPEGLDRLFYELETQYIDRLFNDMATAGMLANVAGPSVGVNLYGWTVGGSAAAGYRIEEEVDIIVPEVGGVTLPSTGVGISPRFFAGVNLGWLFRQGYDPYGEPSSIPPFFSLRRIDLYISGLKHSYSESDASWANGGLEAGLSTIGFDIHYHLVEGRNIKGGSMFRFRGLALRTGFHRTTMDIGFTDQSPVRISGPAGSRIDWLGENVMQYDMRIDSIPLELRTGFQLLYFLELQFGWGMSWNSGHANFHLRREGPVDFIVQHEDQDLLDAIYENPDAALSTELNGTGEIPSFRGYGRVGVGLNIWAVKLTVEGLLTDGTYGVQVGMRFEL